MWPMRRRNLCPPARPSPRRGTSCARKSATTATIRWHYMGEPGNRLSCASSATNPRPPTPRSEEHTSELQSQSNLVCRLLPEKKKIIPHYIRFTQTFHLTPFSPRIHILS